MNKTKLKLFMGMAIYKSPTLSEGIKVQLINYIQKEQNEARLLSVLMDGVIKKVDVKEEKVLRERFEKSGYNKLIQEGWNDLEDEEKITALVGLATISAIVVGGAKIVKMLKEKYNSCRSSCKKAGDKKAIKVCMIRCKIVNLEEQLAHLRKVDCSRRRNPAKCHEKAGILAGKIRRKIEALKNELTHLK